MLKKKMKLEREFYRLEWPTHPNGYIFKDFDDIDEIDDFINENIENPVTYTVSHHYVLVKKAGD